MSERLQSRTLQSKKENSQSKIQTQKKAKTILFWAYFYPYTFTLIKAALEVQLVQLHISYTGMPLYKENQTLIKLLSLWLDSAPAPVFDTFINHYLKTCLEKISPTSRKIFLVRTFYVIIFMGQANHHDVSQFKD